MSDISSNPVVDWGGLMANAQLSRAQTGQAQATTALTQQQTQSAAMANQLTQARMPLIMQALSDYQDGSANPDSSGVAPSRPTAGATGKAGASPPSDTSGAQSNEPDPNTSWYDPKSIDTGLRSNFFVPPVLPGEAKAIQRAALIGDPGLLESVKQQRQLRVDQQLASSQYQSNNVYDTMQAVTDAEPGTALAQLEAIAPNTVKKIRAQLPDEADEDAAARAYAAHVAGAVHQYSGRKVVARPDGTYIDEVTGKPVPGVEKSGLSEDQWAGIAKSGVELTDMNDGQGHVVKIPKWQANGAPSLSAWVMQQAAHGGVHGAQPTVSGAPKAAASAGAAAGIAKATKEAPPAGDGAQPGSTMTNGEPDPTLGKALADKDYKFIPPTHKFGTALSPDEQELKTKQAESSVQLKKDMDEGIPAAQNALTFYKAAQDILDSKGATTGKYTSLFARAGQWLPGAEKPDSTTNYQELAKYLSNAALQAGKAIFPKMTQKEGDWVLNKLNPSPEMTETAVRNMIATGVGMSQYSLDGAQKAGAYLKTGGDATRFYSWLNKHYPQAEAVSQAAKEAAPVGKSMPSGSKLTSYAATHFKGDESAAKVYLTAHGYK